MGEVINLCSILPEETDSEPGEVREDSILLYALKPFVIGGHIYSLQTTFSIDFLVDTGCTAYTLINSRLVNEVCDRLGIGPIRLAKSKQVRGWDGKIARERITHAIFPSLNLFGRREHSVPMLIADLGGHQAILGKPWMNKNQLLLNMADDSIIFPKPPKPPPPAPLPETNLPLLPTKILSRPKPGNGEDSFSIRSVGAGPYSLLARQKDVHIFAMSMSDLDRQIASDTEDSLEAIHLSDTEIAS